MFSSDSIQYQFYNGSGNYINKNFLPFLQINCYNWMETPTSDVIEQKLTLKQICQTSNHLCKSRICTHKTSKVEKKSSHSGFANFRNLKSTNSRWKIGLDCSQADLTITLVEAINLNASYKHP